MFPTYARSNEGDVATSAYIGLTAQGWNGTGSTVSLEDRVRQT